MTKEDILRQAEKFGLIAKVVPGTFGEFICVYDKREEHYIRLLNYNGKWYGCQDGRVGKGGINEKWVKDAIAELKGGKK